MIIMRTVLFLVHVILLPILTIFILSALCMWASILYVCISVYVSSTCLTVNTYAGMCK